MLFQRKPRIHVHTFRVDPSPLRAVTAAAWQVQVQVRVRVRWRLPIVWALRAARQKSFLFRTFMTRRRHQHRPRRSCFMSPPRLAAFASSYLDSGQFWEYNPEEPYTLVDRGGEQDWWLHNA